MTGAPNDWAASLEKYLARYAADLRRTRHSPDDIAREIQTTRESMLRGQVGLEILESIDDDRTLQ